MNEEAVTAPFPKSIVWVSILASLAIVAIYWYYSEKQFKMSEEVYESLKGSRVGSSNRASPTHNPVNAGEVVFPKTDSEVIPEDG